MTRMRVHNMADNGPPPSEPVALYPGEVIHHRLKPFQHRFKYAVCTLAVDIDQMEKAERLSFLLGMNKAAPVSFHARDHLLSGYMTLRDQVEDQLSQKGISRRPERIVLVTFPRIFGYVFNPIAAWYCYDDNQKLMATIYAVRNTFGENHSYVFPVLEGELSAAGLRQDCAKCFHVSPFISMQAHYHFRALPPGKEMRMRIHETEYGQPVLEATLRGDFTPVTSSVLARMILRHGLMTFKIISAIHWQALKLWLKGARFYRSPEISPQTQARKPTSLEPAE